jgi:hypothetical protein
VGSRELLDQCSNQGQEFPACIVAEYVAGNFQNASSGRCRERRTHARRVMTLREKGSSKTRCPQMISVAAAITIPVTNAVKQEKSNRSLRTTLMAASPLRAMVDFAQGTPLPWRKRDLVELWDQILRKVAFADPSNLGSRAAFVMRGRPQSQLITICGSFAPCRDRRSAPGAPANAEPQVVQLAGSNDQCEQFNDAYSDH